MRWSQLKISACGTAVLLLSTCVRLACASSVPDAGAAATSSTPGGVAAQQEPDSVSVASMDWGWQGPLSWSMSYNDSLGALLSVGYSQLFGAHHHYAYAGKLEWGAKQHRINLTVADQLSRRQRIKVSAERLAQDRMFDFHPGAVTKWVSQYAAGLSYQFQPNLSQHYRLDLNGYYAQSQGQMLSPYAFCEGDSVACTHYENLRHIAGATVEGLDAGMVWQPWHRTLLKLAASYDQLTYASRYHVAAENVRGFGYTLDLQQRLWQNAVMHVSWVQKKTEQDLSAALQWLHLTGSHVPVSIGVRVAQLQVPGSAAEHTIEVSLEGQFGQHYQVSTSSAPSWWQALTPLREWVLQPAVYMSTVYAAVDEQQQQQPIHWCAQVSAEEKTVNSEHLHWCAASGTALHQAVPGLLSSQPQVSYHLVVTDQNADQYGKVLYDGELTETQFDIMHLRPRGQYKAVVTAKGNQGYKPVTAQTTFTTGDSVIHWPTRQLTLQDATRSSMSIAWQADASSNDENDILDYGITLSSGGKVLQTQHVHAPKAVSQVSHFDDLQPDHLYQLLVTVTDSDHSPALASDPLQVKTQTDHFVWPDQHKISVTDLTASHLTVHFKADATVSNPGDSVSYHVQARNTASGQVVEQQLQQVHGNMAVTLEGLQPQQSYRVTVTASDRLQQFSDLASNAVDVQNILRWPQSRSVAVEAITATSAQVAWQTGATDTIPGASVDYHAQLHTASGQLVQQLNTTAGTWSLQALDPGQHYYVQVTAEDDRGLKVKSNRVFFQTPNNAIAWPNPNIQASVFADVASLTWHPATPPEVHAGSTIRYHVMVTGAQSGHVYCDRTQTERRVDISEFRQLDTVIHVVITASDDAADEPAKVAESIPVGQLASLKV